MVKTSHGDFWRRAFLLIGPLLPFLLFLFLLPEPAQDSQTDDYLPSSRARSVNVKIIKSLKSVVGERAGGGDVALAGHTLATTNFIISIRAESVVQRRHFDLLVHRPARSPPNFSL